MDGRIDRFPIVAELSQFDSSYEFRYFYLSQRKDIRLSGSPGKKWQPGTGKRLTGEMKKW